MVDENNDAPENGAAESLPAETPAPPRGERLTIEQNANWGGIWPIALLNAGLNIITVSLWRFWGRARVRRYLWSTTTINGTPLDYTGTGLELFRSFVFVMLLIFLPISGAFIAGQLMLPPDQFALYFGLAYIPTLLLFSWLFGIAIWVARRYRFSRTSWRGIRFGQSGSANGFAWASIGYGLLTSITMGWYEPAKEMRLSRRLWRETFFGDRSFGIAQDDEGLAGPLYPTYALAWFGGIIAYVAAMAVYMAVMWPVIEAAGDGAPEMNAAMIATTYFALLVFAVVAGFLSLPYHAAVMRRKAEILVFEGLRFRLRVTALGLGWIYLGNLVLIIFTLGLGLPFAQMRLWRYVLSRLECDGEIDIDAIRQNADRGPKSGEGLADAFDIGNII
tara:strand:- start:3303 stop:4472 length:1170 start_codon:yes stop_codon:yes gene_type:complete